MLSEWKTVKRPGQLGKRGKELSKEWDLVYGPGNWRIAWVWNNGVITRKEAYQIYEDGYYHDSFRREVLWQDLTTEAKDVYDIEERDVESGLNYFIQKGPAVHLQDIAIRRVFLRRGWEFKGENLVQIRSRRGYYGDLLSPGVVSFHLPKMITEPPLGNSWWKNNSIEDFYQRQKVLQVKKYR